MDSKSKQILQKKLARVRPPRVHIAYNVGADGADERRELPFELLVLADLSQAESPKPRKDRELVDIDLDTFDLVLSKVAPRLDLQVLNKLGGKEPILRVELRFRCLDDFTPAAIANQIEPLKNALHERSE